MTVAPTGVADAATDLAHLLAAPTPFLFFTGKGGVGKTSCASAVAVALADSGRRVLIVSTDPASNLPEVLATVPGEAPTPVPWVPGLDMLDLDPVEAAARYREGVVGPYRGLLPDSAVEQIEEELSGSCTVEVAAFNEFVALLTGQTTAGYDHVVFDTAPTGHTLRLLALPAAWDGFLATNTSGVTCVGPVSSLGQTREAYAAGLAALRDGDRTTVVLVTRAEPAALAEAARAAGDLRELGMVRQHLVVNGVLTDPGSDPVAVAGAQLEAAALAAMPEALSQVDDVDVLPLLARAPLGVDGLRAALDPTSRGATTTDAGAATAPSFAGLAEIIEAAAAAGPGIVMTMGKGGVGKTTMAAAIALGLATRGLPVTLTTTDPADHLGMILPDPPANLTVTGIDPHLETVAYQQQVMDDAGAQLDAGARDLLAEDLRSPCTEEVAVFYAFARTVADAADRWVVIDTAPTGHTLLLLQSAHGFADTAADGPASRLYATLMDADRTRIVLVTLPESTPVHEAVALQDDLARTGLTPWTWVVNQALSTTGTTHPVLQARAHEESRWIAEAHAASARTPVVLPRLNPAPAGRAGLQRLLD
jgi:arsenite-transporting ATPase